MDRFTDALAVVGLLIVSRPPTLSRHPLTQRAVRQGRRVCVNLDNVITMHYYSICLQVPLGDALHPGFERRAFYRRVGGKEWV